MINKYIAGLLALSFSIPAFAFEDCIITTNGKLTDIRIHHNDIIDVYPLITIENNKNTLIVHPLKEGETKFTVLKNNKDKYLFSVNVTEDKTAIEVIEGFGIFTIDNPPSAPETNIDLDEPPMAKDSTNAKEMIEEAKQYQEFIDNLDAPPELRGMD